MKIHHWKNSFNVHYQLYAEFIYSRKCSKTYFLLFKRLCEHRLNFFHMLVVRAGRRLHIFWNDHQETLCDVMTCTVIDKVSRKECSFIQLDFLLWYEWIEKVDVIIFYVKWWWCGAFCDFCCVRFYTVTVCYPVRTD